MTVFQDQPNPSAVLLRAGELVVVSEEKDNKRGDGFIHAGAHGIDDTFLHYV